VSNTGTFGAMLLPAVHNVASWDADAHMADCLLANRWWESVEMGRKILMTTLVHAHLGGGSDLRTFVQHAHHVSDPISGREVLTL
jgi:hypothetical protein